MRGLCDSRFQLLGMRLMLTSSFRCSLTGWLAASCYLWASCWGTMTRSLLLLLLNLSFHQLQCNLLQNVMASYIFRPVKGPQVKMSLPLHYVPLILHTIPPGQLNPATTTTLTQLLLPNCRLKFWVLQFWNCSLHHILLVHHMVWHNRVWFPKTKT